MKERRSWLKSREPITGVDPRMANCKFCEVLQAATNEGFGNRGLDEED